MLEPPRSQIRSAALSIPLREHSNTCEHNNPRQFGMKGKASASGQETVLAPEILETAHAEG